MRVLFLITVRGHGTGGHFHSLNHISQAMAEKVEVGICSYGTGRSSILENNPNFQKHIPFNGLKILTLRKHLKKLINEFNPDIIHCFDTHAYNIFTFLFNPNKFSIFLTKCGGPNPEGFPLVENLILFSEENKKWFDDRAKFRKSNIVVIPNRVNPKIIEFNFRKPIIKENAFCFVRIARIGSAYKKSIEDSITLIKYLTNQNLNVHLYIIGAIQDTKIAEELTDKIAGLPISMINDEAYTKKASNLLYLANAVIATGRGIMEGTAISKPILTPAQNSEIPIAVNENNFETFFNTNFSERNRATEKCLEDNESTILNLIQNEEYYNLMSDFSKECFEKYFNTSTGVPQYLSFYEVNANSRRIPFNIFSNLVIKLKTWYSFIK